MDEQQTEPGTEDDETASGALPDSEALSLAGFGDEIVHLSYGHDYELPPDAA